MTINKSVVHAGRLAHGQTQEYEREKPMKLLRFQLRAMLTAHEAGTFYETHWEFSPAIPYSELATKRTVYTPCGLSCHLRVAVSPDFNAKPFPKAPKLKLVPKFTAKPIDANLESSVLDAGKLPKIDAYVIRHESGLMLAQSCIGDPGLDVRGQWTVTHSQSGKKIANAMSFRRALALLNNLLGMAVDWTLAPEQLSAHPDAKTHSAKLKELVQAA